MAEPQHKAVFVPPDGGAPLAWFGELHQYLAVGEQTEHRFALSVRELSTGAGTGSVILNQTHIAYFVTEGELTVTVGNRNLMLPDGGLLTIAPGTAQKVVNAGREPVRLYAISGPAGLDEFHFRTGVPLPTADASTPTVTDADRETLAALAPIYGIDLHPGDDAWQSTPRFRVTLPGEGKTLAVAGDLYRFLAVSDDTGGRFALFHVTVPPGNGQPWQTHSREEELFLVLRGEMTFQTDGTTQSVAAGGLAHLPCGVRHRFENESADVAEMLLLTAPGGLEKLFDAVGHPWHDPAALPATPEHREIERLIEESPQHGIELFF